MQISARELHEMARAVDERHRAAMHTFTEQAADAHADAVRSSRRGFLRRAGVAGVGGAALTALPAVFPATQLLKRAAAAGLSDVDIAVFAESVELAAVAIYRDPDVGSLLTADVAAVAQLFAQHHDDHASAFAALAGAKATGAPNAPIVQAFTDLKPTIEDQDGVLELAFVVENQAASTYAFALTALQSADAAAGTATILPVEAEHAAVIGAVLGKPLADQFPTGAFVAATVGELGDAAVGLDPAMYPVA